jgi:hypothetical protein
MTSHPTDDVASLAARLESTNADERAAAAEKLCQTGESAATAAIPLVRACGDADERVREWAVAALEDLGPPPADAIATLATRSAMRRSQGAVPSARRRSGESRISFSRPDSTSRRAALASEALTFPCRAAAG